MSSHPGSTIRDAVRLAEYLHEHNINPQQVQDFYPTPGTISTCMFYTGIDPFTMKKVYVPKLRMKNRYNVHCCNTEIPKITNLFTKHLLR